MKKVKIFLILFFISTVAALAYRPFGESNALFEQFFYVSSSLIASISAFLALKAYGKGPRFYSLLFMFLGALNWLIADALFDYYDFILRQIVYPSTADYFYLFGYIFFSLGILYEIYLADISWKKLSKKVYAISGIFTSIAIFVFSYITLFHSYSPEVSILENIATIGYSVGDIVLIISGFFIMLVIWEYKGGKGSRMWIYLLLGLFSTLIADLIYAIYTEEFDNHIGLVYNLTQYFYVFGYLSIAYAFVNLRSILLSFQNIKHKK